MLMLRKKLIFYKLAKTHTFKHFFLHVPEELKLTKYPTKEYKNYLIKNKTDQHIKDPIQDNV